MDKIYLIAPEKLGTINPDIYGVFAEHIGGVIYDGIYVGEDNSHVENVHGFRKMIIDKLKAAKIPLVRWPGGCFAEIYDWKDGIGPKEDRPTRVSWWTYHDGRYEPNQVGTDEFLDFCALCEAKPYIAANLTSTTPQNIRDWVDYCNSPEGTTTMAKLRAANGHPAPYNVKMWGVGNENWGGGGNMTPSYYANEYRQYATIMDNTAKGLELFACGSNAADYNWTHGLLAGMQEKWSPMHGMAVHYYCGGAGDPVNFTNDEWNALIGKAGQMQELIDRHWSIVKAYHKEGMAKLCIDEWGCWHPDGSGPSKGYNLFEQQSTMRDAVVSALTLNIFNNNCDKIRLAAVAQLVNNLHALFLSGGENCICTPTYHVFDMFKNHQNGTAIRTLCDGGISSSASIKDGKLTLTLANLTPDTDKTLSLEACGFTLDKAEGILLAHEDLHAHNTFAAPENVAPVPVEIGETVWLPRGSVMTITADITEA